MLLVAFGGIDLLLQHCHFALQPAPKQSCVAQAGPGLLDGSVQFLYLGLYLLVLFFDMLVPVPGLPQFTTGNAVLFPDLRKLFLQTVILQQKHVYIQRL